MLTLKKMRMCLSDKEQERAAIRGRVAANMREARQFNRMSVEDLSIELGVAWKTVMRWEHRETDITLFDASRCARALKIPLEQLLSE